MKKISRRKFISTSVATTVGVSLLGKSELLKAEKFNSQQLGEIEPIVISTWNRGLGPNKKAWEVLMSGGTSLDAVEQGVRVAEDDPTNNSVGFGGLPDEDGIVTLDASIMDWQGRCGAVAYLQNIKNPISVARKVMEHTRHVMLAGEGAKSFALKMGFKEENLLTEESRQRWLKWKQNLSDIDFWKSESHDTITMLAIDKNGNISGACTTSGLFGKIHGRVGDSPIIGGGLFVDNEVGAAGGTGIGETIMRTCGSFLIVEKMREGLSPQEACEYVIRRVIEKNKKFLKTPFQCAFIALNKNGEFGAYSVMDKFEYIVTMKGKDEIYKSNFEIKQ